MSKRRKVTSNLSDVCKFHFLKTEEKAGLSSNLLKWYDKNKRDLPWRKEAKRFDDNERAYAVWVSEIMLQQTQVATVIDYYTRWMKKWPTLRDLTKSSLEEVHEMWAGLGYYSRGTRLREGAIKVETELKGEMPKTAESLEKHLPGVGKYTAGAIASIAFGQVTGVVDGNVSRVFSRLKGIGADSTSQLFIDQIWKYANETVDEHRPGDYNQALMELGATVCTPKKPSCDTCPVKGLCVSYKQVQNEMHLKSKKLVVTQKPDILTDIEEAVSGCKLCLADNDWESSLGVCNYPRKAAKKQARRERSLVYIIQRKGSDKKVEYLLSQRPEKGLLASMWEFPSYSIVSDSEIPQDADSCKYLHKIAKVASSDIEHCIYQGEVAHLFSHIHQTYLVYTVKVVTSSAVHTCSQNASKWVGEEELLQMTIPTGMIKVLKHSQNLAKKTKTRLGGKKSAPDGKKQMELSKYFSRAPKRIKNK